MPRAKSKKGSKSRSKVDKRQDRQLVQLRKMVVGEKPRIEDIYKTAIQQLPNRSLLVNLINYDNQINYTGSNVKSRNVFRLNNKIYMRGRQDPTAQSALNTHRPVRVIYFMWKADVVPGAISGFNVVAPTNYDLFDDFVAVDPTTVLQRLSYKNRHRIKIMKDTTKSITNHSGIENDTFFSFSTQSKYGHSYKYPTEDQSGPARMWMPYVLILDAEVTASYRSEVAMTTHVLYTEENF